MKSNKNLNVPNLRFPEFIEEWEVKRLEKLFSEFKSGQNITASQIQESGEYPVYGGNGLRGYFNEYTHDGYYFLIGRQGALCGNINRSEGRAYFSEHAIACMANKENDTEWLAQRLDYYNLNRLSESSAQPGLSVKKLLRFKLTVPNKPEQQKIASFLTKIDKRIETQSKIIEYQESLIKGLLQQVFSQQIRFKDEQNMDYPDWEEKKLGDIFQIGSGKDYKHLQKGSIPVYGTGGYMTSVNNYVYDGESVGIGRKGTIDKPVFLTGKFWTVDTLFYTHSFTGVSPRFIFLLFKQINWLKYNEASGVPSLSKTTIEKIKVKIPIFAEQQKIASFLSSLDAKLEKEKQILAQYQQQKTYLLQNLFI